jgi:Flp pilus assembly protein TadD
MGWLQTRRGAWHEARTALDRSLHLNPENAGVWALRAWALWCQGSDRAEARASLRRALEIDPRNPQASIVARQMSGGV